jgi:polygalacturonase
MISNITEWSEDVVMLEKLRREAARRIVASRFNIKTDDPASLKINKPTSISIVDYGGKGDGVTNNTAHFRAAVAALEAQGGGTLRVPSGNFTSGGFNLTSNMVLQLEQGAVISGIQPASPETAVYDFPLVQTLPSFGNGYRHQALVQGWGLTNVTIEGNGTIWGGGDIWWEWFGYAWEGPQRKDRCLHGRPYTIHLHACSAVTLRDVHVMRSPFWTVHLSYSHQVLVERLHVITNDTATGAPALPGRLAQPPTTSQPCNADGIDIDSSTHVHVRDSIFWTHDDSIALKSGTNWFGRHANRPTEHVLIENCKAESLDGAVVIGSEMSGGVRNVTVRGLDIRKAGFAFWIKSERGRGGMVRDITFQGATLHTTAGVVAGRRVISLDMYYHQGHPPGNHSSTPSFQGRIEISDFRVLNPSPVLGVASSPQHEPATGAGGPVLIRGLPESPITGVVLRNLSLGDEANKSIVAVECVDAHVASASGVHFDGKLWKISPQCKSEDTAGPLNVRDFGATGHDSVDDTISIQRAMFNHTVSPPEQRKLRRSLLERFESDDVSSVTNMSKTKVQQPALRSEVPKMTPATWGDLSNPVHPDPRLLRLLQEISEWIINLNIGSNDIYSPGPGPGCKSFWCSRMPSYIFVNGNMARVLLAAHSVTGNRTYLDEGLRWCDSFVKLKHTIVTSSVSPLGMGSNHTGGAWWDTGYGTIYFGDTGTAHQALALCAIKLPLGNERRAQYIMAMREYAAFVQGGCIQHEGLVYTPPLPADLPGKAKIMRSLGLSEAAIQAAFDIDWPSTTTAKLTAKPLCPSCPLSTSHGLPCPGGILQCPAKGGWIEESGAVGDGWVDGELTTKPYSCSTATTGAGSFGALSAVLRGALDCDGVGTNCSAEADMAQAVSFKAATWLASTVNPASGVVKNYNWDGKTSNVSGMGGVAYITDGMVQANILGIHTVAPAMRKMAIDVARKITDKGWGTDGRSPRVATLLQWHEHTFKSDPVVSAALQKFVDFITSDRARFSPTTGSCAAYTHGGFCLMNNTITTGMVGLVVADLLQFNSTFAWGLPPPAILKTDDGPAVTLVPMFPSHGKPGMVALGNDLFTVGALTSDCMAGLRRSSDSGRSFGPLICAASHHIPDGSTAAYKGCRLRDGPVAMGDEVTGELVLIFWCAAKLRDTNRQRNVAQDEVWVTKASSPSFAHWSTPKNITASVQIPDQTGIKITIGAIGGGIQATNGRLVAQGYGVKCFADSSGGCNASGAFSKQGESRYSWAEINHVVYSDDHAETWKASDVFGIYGAEGKVVQAFDPPNRLLYNYRVDGPMTDRCPDGAAICDTGWHGNSTMACGQPSVAMRPAPHHCRATMFSDDWGTTWTNGVDGTSLFGTTVPDLPDPGCDGGITRWEAKKALVMSNVQDTGDPGIEQQPRYNLTVSISLDSGRTWPHRVIVYPAHRGAVGYSDVRVAKNGMIVVHFDTLVGGVCASAMQPLCGTEMNQSKSGGSTDDCIACALRNRARLEAPFFYAPKKESLPSGCGRSPNVTSWHAGWQPSPDQFMADIEGACRRPVARDSPGSTLVATVDGNAVLQTAPH